MFKINIRFPSSYRRGLLLLSVVWGTTIYILFSFNQMQFVNNPPKLGRELLQQDALDYINDISAFRQLSEILDAKLKIDKGRILNMHESFQRLLKNSNVPLTYWMNTYSANFSTSKCLKFPNIFDLKFNNIYWQMMKFGDTTFYLLNAYYDMRVRVGTIPLVRILAMVNKISPPRVVCQFWYGNVTKTSIPERLMFSGAFYTYMWVKSWGNYKDGILQPYLISCPVPKIGNMSYVPASVSLVEQVCEKPTNILKVIYNHPSKKENFAVCVKGLDFLYEDISVKLIEWIELLHILGAKKIFMYELETHPNVSKVLSYYSKKGMIELTPITLPGAQPNLPGFRHLYLKWKLTNKRQNELIPYNDCLYKNLYSYDYIVLLDTDEVILPLANKNWHDMMADVINLAMKEEPYMRASYNFRNVYFFDEMEHGNVQNQKGIPKYLHMLQHVYRSKNYTKLGNYVKCFHDVERVISLHNHFPINCFGLCSTYSVSTSIGHLQHYRKDCVDPLKSKCEDFKKNTIRDTSIWNFKDALIQRTTEALFNLGFLKSEITKI